MGVGMSEPTLDDVAEVPVWLAWQGEPAKPGEPPRKVPYAKNPKALKTAHWFLCGQQLGHIAVYWRAESALHVSPRLENRRDAV